ncbi:MAG: peptidoglycan-associated lipoprotein Pal [Bacteriovoracia bacterium]
MRAVSAPVKNKLFALISVSLVLFAASCGKKDVKEDEDTSPDINSVNADINTNGDSDQGKAGGLRTVHFPYDSFVLNAEGKQTLAENAKILKEKKNLAIQVEGHCDERGGIQYNIALGEKRANAVKKYLHDLGVSDARITTISFGKERPLDQGHTEAAWAANRRANFVITSK